MKPLLSALTEIPLAIRAPIAIALGAIPGAWGRYYATLIFARWFGNDFPYATFLVNFSGCILMGMVVTLDIPPGAMSPDLRLLIAVGFLGAYTTFSTFALEVTALLRTGNISDSLIYGLGSLVLGAIGIWLGSLVADRWG
ncbi:MAG: fluoride efflux transporter CrcB [Synechocystis sp.]